MAWRETLPVDFVTSAFATWLLEQMADAGRKRLTTFFLGEEQERAVQAAATVAIGLTAASFCPPGSGAAEHLAMVIDQVFAEPVPPGSSIGEATLLEALHVGIANQLAVLDDVALTGTGESSAELLGVPGMELAEHLARCFVKEIVSRGTRGGPLAPLANQVNHDLTHLQGRSLEAKLDRLTSDVEQTLRERQQAAQVGQNQVAGSLGRPVHSWSALELEVHRPIVVDGAPTDVTEYIERKHDQQVRDCLVEKLPKLIVIVGGSSTGKTRAAYEAVKRLPPDWRLHYPVYPNKPQALVESLKPGKIAHRTVIWLNELQQYLLPVGGEEASAALREYLQGDDEVALIGTIWPDYWQELARSPSGLEDPHSQARALLLFAACRIEMHSHFPPHRLNALAAKDARIRMALERGGDHITQYIAAGPALVEYYLDAKATAPPVWAVLSATMDYCLIDRYGEIPDVTLEFLEAAALGYMSDEERGVLQEDWLAGALGYASVLLRGATRPLAAVRSRKNDFAAVRFRLADYLLQYARRHRFSAPMPASFWDGISADLDTVYVPAFAEAAQDRGMYQQSAELWDAEAQEGNPVALAALLKNPRVDRKAAERTAIEAIQNVDMSDIYIIGWMLVELREYQDLHNRLVNKIVAHVQELGVRGSEPLEMSIILQELIENSRYEAISSYVHRIHEMIADVDLSDFWSAESLVEELLVSELEDGRRAGLTLADSLYRRYKTDPGQLVSLLRVVASENSDFYDEGIRELRLLVNGLQDVNDVISITPLIASLRALPEAGAYEKLLERVCGSISTLTLGSSYAPLEMISLLREEGLDWAADELSIRVSVEFDPGISGATAHALRYLRPLMTSDIYEAFAVRMATEGPILPVAEAEEVAECFAEMQNLILRQAYLQRVQQFRAAEGN